MANPTPAYELIDFGAGRKLERIGGRLLDRPCPPAVNVARALAPWPPVDARFEADRIARGRWVGVAPPAGWECEIGSIVLSLRQGEFGHVGVFPEQAPLWSALSVDLGNATGAKVLSLFAYTGGATLAAAAAGAEVVHVDSSKSAVDWARRNAERSGLSEAPIRWIVDDAAAFVAREIRRGRRYDAIVLDPPSYGAGGKGRRWSIDSDLPALLDDCRTLTGPTPRRIVLSCHSPGWGRRELGDLLATRWPAGSGSLHTQGLCLPSQGGAKLTLGSAAVWTARPEAADSWK